MRGPPANPPETPPELKRITLTTIGQAYYCIRDSYYSGPVLDDRSLLVPAFAALTQELQGRGLDQSEATLPSTITVIAAPSAPPGPEVESELVDGNFAYVTMPAFALGSADRVLATIAELRKTTKLRRVILDLRSNSGGAPEAVSKLLGALPYDNVTSYRTPFSVAGPLTWSAWAHVGRGRLPTSPVRLQNLGCKGPCTGTH
jgi:hypothetical protein